MWENYTNILLVINGVQKEKKKKYTMQMRPSVNLSVNLSAEDGKKKPFINTSGRWAESRRSREK